MALSVEDLRAFTLVVRERSVSGAAAALGVTQQSVSERIRRLERRLGVELFDRRPHGMEPTAAGFRLLPLAQQSVVLMDRAMSVVDDDDLIRVAVQEATADAVRPLLDLALSGSRLEVSVQAEASEVLGAVAAGSLDVGFGSFTEADDPARALSDDDTSSASSAGTDGDPSGAAANGHGSAGGDIAGADASGPGATSALVIEQLFTDPVIWVAPPDHPLLEREGPVPATDLSILTVGVTAPGGADGDHNGNGGGGAGGLRIAPLSTVAEALRKGRLVEVPVELPGWVLPVSIAYRATERERPAISALRAAVLEEHQRAVARDARSTQGARR